MLPHALALLAGERDRHPDEAAATRPTAGPLAARDGWEHGDLVGVAEPGPRPRPERRSPTPGSARARRRRTSRSGRRPRRARRPRSHRRWWSGPCRRRGGPARTGGAPPRISRRSSAPAAQPPIIDIDRAGRRNDGSLMPCPARLAHTAWRSSSASSASLPPDAQDVPHRVLPVGEQAVADGPVGGEPEAVARAAEGSGHARDDADLAAAVDEAVAICRRRRRRPVRWPGSSGQTCADARAGSPRRARPSTVPRPRPASSGMNSMKRTTRPVSRAKPAKIDDLVVVDPGASRRR